MNSKEKALMSHKKISTILIIILIITNICMIINIIEFKSRQRVIRDRIAHILGTLMVKHDMEDRIRTWTTFNDLEKLGIMNQGEGDDEL